VIEVYEEGKRVLHQTQANESTHNKNRRFYTIKSLLAFYKHFYFLKAYTYFH